MLKPHQVEIVRRSFDAIWPVRRNFAAIFYQRFFELAPDARAMFRGDIERQQVALMDMIAAIVGALDERELVRSIVSHTGRQHALFGVRDSHFDAFEDALMRALETQFGAAFDDELRAAWTALYWLVYQEMSAAAGLSVR
jgi:hemoglobin-like flavoprotein